MLLRVPSNPSRSLPVKRSNPLLVPLVGTNLEWLAEVPTPIKSPNSTFLVQPSQGLSVAWPPIGLALPVSSMSTLEANGLHLSGVVAIPHSEERVNCPIPPEEFEDLLQQAGELLNVNENEFDISIRHRELKKVLTKAFPNREVKNIPLAVKRREDNPQYVTWSGSDTLLGDAIGNDRLTIRDETRVTAVFRGFDPRRVRAALLRDLKSNKDVLIFAKVILCTVP